MLRIALNPELTQAERTTIARYLVQHGRLNSQDWQLALRAFDLLRNSTVIDGEQRETFSEIYSRLVEEEYVDDFLDQLLALESDILAAGERLKAAVARTIAESLANAGLYQRRRT